MTPLHFLEVTIQKGAAFSASLLKEVLNSYAA